MKLVIKDYLMQLKESGELDALLPDLLLAMNIRPFSKPQKGNRQNGVDIAAIKEDKNGNKKLYLFVIKSGNLGRYDWDGSGPQAIRPSLDDIKDTYIRQLNKDFQCLPKEIVLVTSGDILQDTLPSWQGYSDNNKTSLINYSFWDGNDLAIKIEKFLLNEKILPTDMKSLFVKTLVSLRDIDYDLSDYYELLEKYFLNSVYSEDEKKDAKILLKKFKLITLMLNIIYRWSQTNNNIKPALLAAERTLLICWELLRCKNFLKKKSLIYQYNSIYDLWFNILQNYFNIIQPLTAIPDGLCVSANDFLLQSLNLFEILGFVSLYGLAYLYKVRSHYNTKDIEHLIFIKNTISALLKNNKGLYSPVYDNHIIEISLALLFLSQVDDQETIQNWIIHLVIYISFAYLNQSKYFPIDIESIDNLIELNIKQSIDKEKLFTLSTLIPTLMEWACILDLPRAYNELKNRFSSQYFSHCNFQIWYPDKNTENYIYKSPWETLETGVTEASLKKDMTMEEMKARIISIQANTAKPEDFSSIKYCCEILLLVSSRHFRIPILPFYWEKLLEKIDLTTKDTQMPILIESSNITWLYKNITYFNSK